MKEMKFREDIAHFSGRNEMGNWDYFTPVSGVMGPWFLGPPCSKGWKSDLEETANPNSIRKNSMFRDQLR